MDFRCRVVTICLTVLAIAALAPRGAAQTTRTPGAATTPLTITRPLYIGESGTDVAALQQFLKSLGYFTYPAITGYYGSFTWTAVAAFQSANKLEPVGYVGPKTRALIASVSSAASFQSAMTATPSTSPSVSLTRSLSQGDSGDDVSALQQFLEQQGFYTYPTITGYFGPVTLSAVEAFQKANGIDPIGIIGPQTRAAIAQLGGGSSAVASNTGTVSLTASPSVPISLPAIPGGYTPGFGGGGGNTSPPTISGTPSNFSVQATSPSGAIVTYAAPTATDPAGGTDAVSCSPALGSTFALGVTTVSCAATDRAGYSASSSFTVTVQDTTAPNVSISAPSNGATVSGTSVTLTATSSDNVGIAGVQFEVDGSNVGASGTTSPYSITWDSTGVADGSHTLYAVAHDAAGNYATSSISIMIRNSPPVISSISSGTPTTTSAIITWTSDEVATSQINYGTTTSYSAASSSGALITSHSVTLTGLSDGTTYHFQVQSVDGQGNTATSSDQTFTTASYLSSGQLATLATLQTAATSAIDNNPVDNSDMSSPPTITQSASSDGSLTVTADYQHNPGDFRVSSGNAYVRTTTNGLLVGTSNWSPSTSGSIGQFTNLSPTPINDGENQVVYDVSFVTSAPVVQFSLRVSGSQAPYRFIVNNQFVARAGYLNTQQYVELNFGSSASRTITLEVQTGGASFLGVAVGSGYTVTAPTDTVVKGVFTGDSITEAVSTGDSTFHAEDGWASTFSKEVGINSMRNAAVGSTGYWNTDGGARSDIYDQMTYWVNGDTYDVIGFAGGYNDQGQVSDATTTADALAAWQRARAAQPNALIIVFGIPGEATGPRAALIATEQALQATFNSWHDPFSLFIPVSTDPNGAWLTGTGYVGHTNGSGNSDTYVSSDGVHPTDAGQIYLGEKADAAYRALLPTLH